MDASLTPGRFPPILEWRKRMRGEGPDRIRMNG